MIVVGGTYIEECDWPEWTRLMGPGVRAALALSEVSPQTELYSYANDAVIEDLRSTMLTSGLATPQVRTREEKVAYSYKHPLSYPRRTPKLEETPDDSAAPQLSESWSVKGDTVLAFRLQETKIVVSAKRAVFELSQQDEEIERGDIGKLALIAAENDFPQAAANVQDFAAQTMPAHNANLLIFRWQSGGGILFDGEMEHSIPAYVANEWFKIGTGNIFCAMFAHYWGEQNMDAMAAADLASRCSAYYAGSRALPIPVSQNLPDMEKFDPTADCKIFIASPCISMAQQWLVDEAIRTFEMLRIQTVTPYDLGLDGVSRKNVDVGRVLDGCSAVLVLAEGADLPSVLAVGLARVRKLPIVVLAEESREPRVSLWQGTDCEIARDFASAVYRAMVAGKRRPAG